MVTTYTLLDALARSRQHNPLKIAIVEGAIETSYEELYQKIADRAATLDRLGVVKGGKVGIFLPRCLDAIVSIFATWSLGAVGIFINETLKPRQLAYILAHSEASHLVVNRRLATLLPQETRIKRFVVDEEQESRARSSLEANIIGANLALLIYTSGSTGMPKGIMLTHENVLAGATIVSDYLNITESDCLISLLPFSFDYGLNQLMCVIYAGATLVLQQSLFPADICATLSEKNITGMAGVPLLWQQLAHPRSPFLRKSFPDLRYITNTGGRMPETITRQIRNAHSHLEIFLMFGLTEAFRSTFLPPDEVDQRPTSIGKPIPNVEVFVVNEKGQQCKPHEIGELLHRGGTVSL